MYRRQGSRHVGGALLHVLIALTLVCVVASGVALPARADTPLQGPRTLSETHILYFPFIALPYTQIGYGVQAHMIGNDMAPIVAAIRGLGFDWAKQQVEWKTMEPAEGDLHWDLTDGVVDSLIAAEIKPLLTVAKAPRWARPPDSDFGVEGPPADPQDLATFVGALATHYRGKVRAYEIWNEENLHDEWGNEDIDAARYVTMLALSYVAIKLADPGAIVISGAPTPTGAPLPWAIDDFDYLTAMYQAGLAGSCDAVGAHSNGYNMPPDADWRTWYRPNLHFPATVTTRHHSWSFKATLEGYRDIMLRYGEGDKAIWVTEFGWASNSAPHANYEYAQDNSLEQQAAYTVKACEMGEAWGWVGPMFLWNLNFKVVAPGSEMAQWGIVDAYWNPLPVYESLATMPKNSRG